MENTFEKWCENQALDEHGQVICLAHLAEARVLNCPYSNEAERKTKKYPCSDYQKSA